MVGSVFEEETDLAGVPEERGEVESCVALPVRSDGLDTVEDEELRSHHTPRHDALVYGAP